MTLVSYLLISIYVFHCDINYIDNIDIYICTVNDLIIVISYSNIRNYTAKQIQLVTSVTVSQFLFCLVVTACFTLNQ